MPSNLVISTRTVMYLLDGGARMKEGGGWREGEGGERGKEGSELTIQSW